MKTILRGLPPGKSILGNPDVLRALFRSPTHAELYARRSKASPEEQRLLAPLEHQAFAREWTKENPWLAAPSLVFAIPAYTAAKATGMTKARSPASFQEIIHGYKGLFEGLIDD